MNLYNYAVVLLSLSDTRCPDQSPCGPQCSWVLLRADLPLFSYNLGETSRPRAGVCQLSLSSLDCGASILSNFHAPTRLSCCSSPTYSLSVSCDSWPSLPLHSEVAHVSHSSHVSAPQEPVYRADAHFSRLFDPRTEGSLLARRSLRSFSGHGARVSVW